MTADRADEQPASIAGLERALGEGADAAVVVRLGTDGALHAEAANGAARALLGPAGADSRPLETDCPPGALALLERVRIAATRSRATREQLVLRDGDGRRVPVDLELEPLPTDADGTHRVLAVVRRDVSDRRAAEVQLAVNEAWFRSLVQHAPDLVVVLAEGGIISYASQSAARMVGRAPEELIGTRLDDHLVDADDEGLRTSEREAIATPGVAVRVEALIRHRDGRARAFEGSIASLRDDPAVRGLVVNLRDVGDRREAEAALRRNEAALRAVVQSSPLAIAALDRGGVVHVWNRASEELFGWPAADVVGGPLPFADGDAAAGDLAGLLDRAFRGETVTRHEGRYPRRDGASLDTEVAIAPLRDASGRVVSAVAVFADVTEQQRAARALRESEARFRSLVQHASDVLTVIDADDRVAYTSPGACASFGLDPDDVERGLVRPPLGAREEDRSELEAVLTRVRARPGSTETVTYRFRRPDGELRWAEMVATNLLDDAAIRGIVVTTRDITEWKQFEQALNESETRLRESESRYRAVVDDQTELVCRYLPDTTITFVNRAFAQFYGRPIDELIGSKRLDLLPATGVAGELDRLRTFGRGRREQTYEDRQVATDGTTRWYRWTDRAFLDDAGELVEIQSVGHDVSEEHRATEFTARQAEILEQIARGVPLGDTLEAIATTIEAHFPRLMCALSMLDDDGLTLRQRAAPSLPEDFVSAIDGLRIGPVACSCGTAAYRREPVYVSDIAHDSLWVDRRAVAMDHGIHAGWATPVLASDGHTVLGTLAVYVGEIGAPDGEHVGVLSALAHVTSIAIERTTFEDRLAHQSMHDLLTGLPNRALFLDRLGLAVARCRRTRSQVAVLFLDLDGFKNVNDGLGHDAGDELLVAVARRLEALVRPGDTVARFGGDEFIILCEDLPLQTGRERSVEIAHRLLAAVGQSFVIRGAETFVGTSAGVALGASGEERPEELLRDAEAAMYCAKDAGRRRVEVFDDTMRSRALARHATENALHLALERGELRLFFQPVVALDDARCIGAEALVRWQHPERGLVAPNDFVPLAEETGLVVALGMWVLEEAALHAARWQLEHDGPFVVSVNLSARQLAQPDLAERVVDVIARTGLEPSNLCFEITESALMDDAESVVVVIERMRELGVGLAIDDFGTGYSSLGYLKRFRVDTVKIDRCFVDGLGADPGDSAIVSAVIGLAHALGLRVVAEGVETEDQLAELVALGCDEAQGYFFAPPQPVQDLRELVSRTRHWRPPGQRVIERR